MKNSIYLSRFICLLIVFNAFQVSAQLSKPFSVRYQSYVKGDMTVIANNIVNRKDAPGGANAPYNIIDVTSKHNDEFNMDYIDIDDDKTTFSSSSAELVLKDAPDAKIVYAGLYWSATYKYAVGKQKRNRKFVADDKSRESIDNIKIKLPSQTSYIDIKGQVIFDGLKENEFEENAPYAVYADITNQIKNLKNPNGTYTVANVKATLGTLSGGVSAGWTIIVVYEDTNQTGKFITTYDGFAGVTSKSTDIDFTGFQTLPEGKVNVKVAGAGLEGDSGLKGDQLAFKSAENKDFSTLENSIREYNNFFNSSITINDKFFTKRLPNSINTLGYDTFLINIHNPGNSVIGNNTKEAKLRMKSTGDRYFMFFCALNVEVVEPVKEIKEIIQEPLFVDNTNKPKTDLELKTNNVATIAKTEPTVNVVKEKIVKPIEKVVTIVEEPKMNQSAKPIEKAVAIIEKESKPVVAVIEKEAKKEVVAVTQKPTSKQDARLTSLRVTPIESATRSFPGEEKGYYIIANVFAVPYNATRFVETLKNKGIDAAFFINPANNYRYVFVSRHDKFADAEALYFSDINNKYHGDLWIMTVNKDDNMVASINDVQPSDESVATVEFHNIQVNASNVLFNNNLDENTLTNTFNWFCFRNEIKLS